MQLCLKRALVSLLSPFRKNVLADCISRWQSIVNLGPRLCLRTALLNTQAPLLEDTPWLEGVSVSTLENLQDWFPPCPLSATPPAPIPFLLISALLNCTLVLQACALDGFPSLPHTSPFFIPMREECAAQFLVVKISTVSSGQTSPYCGSYATLC